MIGHRNLSLALLAGTLAVAPAMASSIEPSRRRSKLLTYTTPMSAVTSASINRWTGKPHEHRREIARRLRQEVRRAQVQA